MRFKDFKQFRISEMMELMELLESNSSDIKDLKNISNELDTDDVKESKKVYNDLIAMLKEKPYEEAVGFIDDLVKDHKLKFILSLGFGGKFADCKLKLKKTNIPVYKLIPTQNEIGLDETLKYMMTGKNIENCFKDPACIKKPVVTFQGTFIIDGHHRWSEIFVTNSKANLECIDIEGNLSPLSMLKAVQATIGSNLGKLIIKGVEGKNLFKCSKSSIEKYLKDMPEDTLEKLKKYYKDPIKSLVDNCMELKVNNTPISNAPKRGDMPQTSKDPELFDDLKKGISKI